MKKLKAVLLTCLLLAALGTAGNADIEEARHAQAEYCEMVQLWQADSARGVPEHKRAGWPPFKGKGVCK